MSDATLSTLMGGHTILPARQEEREGVGERTNVLIALATFYLKR